MLVLVGFFITLSPNSKGFPQILKILFRTGPINVFALLGIMFTIYFQKNKKIPAFLTETFLTLQNIKWKFYYWQNLDLCKVVRKNYTIVAGVFNRKESVTFSFPLKINMLTCFCGKKKLFFSNVFFSIDTKKQSKLSNFAIEPLLRLLTSHNYSITFSTMKSL